MLGFNPEAPKVAQPNDYRFTDKFPPLDNVRRTFPWTFSLEREISTHSIINARTLHFRFALGLAHFRFRLDILLSPVQDFRVGKCPTPA